MHKLQRQNALISRMGCSSNPKKISRTQTKVEKRQVKLQGHKTSKMSEQAASRNPYLNYFRQFYNKRGGKVVDVAKEAGANWKKMTPSEKNPFIQMAKSAKYVFNSRNKKMNKIFEMFDINKLSNPPSAAEPHNNCGPKDSSSIGHLSKTRNPFINYFRDYYSGHKASKPTDSAKEASSTWNRMQPQEKNKYIDSAKSVQYKFYFRIKRLNKIFRLLRPVVTEKSGGITAGKHNLDQVYKYLKLWQSDVYRKAIAGGDSQRNNVC